LPDLVKDEAGYRFFYEIKSNVSREDLRMMRMAGVRAVQPGIESLSSAVLRLMRKGVTASQNVNLLRWAKYYGLQVSWNVLWGFPDEKPEYYESQAKLFAQLSHLEPPTGAGPVWLERFSPLYNERDKFKAAHVAPEKSYSYVYPQEVDLDQIAYFFDFQLENTLENDFFGDLAAVTDAWQTSWKADVKPKLEYYRSGDFIQIDDRRNLDQPVTHTFEGAVTELYVALSERPRKIDPLRADLNLTFAPEQIKAVLDELCRRGLMMEDEGAYLSLALPASSAHGDHHDARA
jgi:ribosomal peptide maturation radical SAM protein 1